MPIATLSVAWLLANPATTSVILGASRIGQLTDTLVASDYQVENGLKSELDEVSIEFAGATQRLENLGSASSQESVRTDERWNLRTCGCCRQAR